MNLRLSVLLLFQFIICSQIISQVTFTKDIAPIIYNNCAVCHRTGEIGPMSLTNYEEVKNWAETIRYVTSIKYMPPWKPDPDFSRFQGENYLSDEEIAAISEWVDNGKPFGDPEDTPPYPDFPDGSVLGQPDLVLSMEQPYLHKGNNLDEYRYFVIPTGLTEDKIVKALEMRPDNKKIVHHALFFEDVTGKARENDAETPEYGFDGFGGFAGDDTEDILSQKQYPGYVPGQKPLYFPDGLGQTLQAGSDLVVQVHYAPWPVDETDQSSFNLFFADENEVFEREVLNHIMVPFFSVINDLFVIYPNTVREFHGIWTVPEDISLIGISPHMHLLGQHWEVYLEQTDGTIVNLIKINEWDFNWQGSYYFNRFIVAEKGAKVHAIASYDNTTENPNNPANPPVFTTWGEGTEDEMYYLPISYVPYQPGDENIVFGEETTNLEELFSGFPENKMYPIYPNPVGTYVNAGFSLEQGTSVRIEIMDLLGRKIRTLRDNEFFNAGKHIINFDASNLEQGSYLLRISSTRFNMTQKFIKP